MVVAEFLEGLGFGSTLVTFLVSLIPVIELRGAIPVGVYLGLPVWKSFVVSIVGNLIPAPFIVLFIRAVFAWIQKKIHWKWLNNFVDRMEAKAEKNYDKVEKGEFWGLLAFVAIPLPGTGAWTGALIAGMLGLRLKKALPPITIGVIIAGILVSLATAGVVQLL